MPSLERPLARSQRSSDPRIGLPDTVVRARGNARNDASNVVPMRCDHPASSRFTRPGTALPSQMYTGTRATRAAITMGSDTRPPVVQQTDGPKRTICARASTAANGSSSARETSEMRESGSRSDGITVAWNGMPAAETSSASRPRRPPRKRKSTSGSAALIDSATARSGLMCPPVPPPTRRTRHRRARRGSGSANAEENTDGDQAHTERRASIRDERERDAGHGHEARDDRHVHPRLEHEPDGDARGEDRSGRILAAKGDAHAAEPEDEEAEDDREGAEQAELVAEHGEDRIGIGRGKEAEFLPAGPEPLAERTAEGEAIQRLDGLESSSTWIRPGIDESEQALVPIRLYDRGGERDRQREQRDCDDAQAAMLDARRDQHRRKAQRGPRRLLREVGARIVVGVERRHAARAVDHRESQQEQREDDDEQRDVIRGGTRQSRCHEATGSANARTSAVKRSPRSSADEN